MLAMLSMLAMLANLAIVKEFAIRGCPAYKWLGTGNKPLPTVFTPPFPEDDMVLAMLEPVWHV